MYSNPPTCQNLDKVVRCLLRKLFRTLSPTGHLSTCYVKRSPTWTVSFILRIYVQYKTKFSINSITNFVERDGLNRSFSNPPPQKKDPRDLLSIHESSSKDDNQFCSTFQRIECKSSKSTFSFNTQKTFANKYNENWHAPHWFGTDIEYNNLLITNELEDEKRIVHEF